MKTRQVVTKVFWASNILTGSVVMLVCMVLKWDIEMIFLATASSFFISAPAIVALQCILWIIKKIRMARSFTWMMLMASIPVLVLVPASLLAKAMPGDIIFLAALGMLSGYVAILGNGLSIAQILNTGSYEK